MIRRFLGRLAILCCVISAPAQPDHTGGSDAAAGLMPGDRFDILHMKKENRWLILPYKPSYILPFTYFEDPNHAPLQEIGGISEEEDEFDDVEVKFQFSFMMPLWREMPATGADLLFAYTQVSFWQLYNSELSSPFRDTNYEPEVFLAFDTDFDVLGFENSAILAGYVHQSNGRGSEAVDRSWDRVYASFLLEKGNLVLGLKPWLRINESEENADIDDYLGYGELRAIHLHKNSVFSAMFRNNFKIPDDNRGAVELGWSRPLGEHLRWYVQYFYGYGENLLDYNYLNHRIGVGVMLNDWL